MGHVHQKPGTREQICALCGSPQGTDLVLRCDIAFADGPLALQIVHAALRQSLQFCLFLY